MYCNLGKREGKVVVWIEWPFQKDVHLPDLVTHPNSLMTCGCGLRVFISSSSDFKSRLSDSAAFATMEAIKRKVLIPIAH